MKNLVRLSTGIVFIMAILIVGACCSKNGNKKNDDSDISANRLKAGDSVIIFITSPQIINDKLHIKLFDTHGNWAQDTLTTNVMPEGKVIWKLDTLCEIEKILHIMGEKDGKIFKNKILEDNNDKPDKRFILELDSIISGEEKYEIKFQMKNDKGTYIVDPILRVPTRQ